VNAWPLDEGLIDYVDKSYGTERRERALYGQRDRQPEDRDRRRSKVDATAITPDFLQNTLQEAGDIEANVATGYHAIEFLLWGQDLNGTGPAPATVPTPTTTPPTAPAAIATAAPPISRRRRLLVSDLEEMVGNWKEDGAARKALEKAIRIRPLGPS
jgi:putative iron-regulated protein